MTSRASDMAPRGRILVDWEIREYVRKYRMIEPFRGPSRARGRHLLWTVLDGL